MPFQVTHGQLGALAVAAVLVFWMLGAYNRLVALRNAIGSAWQTVDEVLKKRAEALLALASDLREPLAGEQGALDALVAAAGQVRSAAEALRARPVMAPLAAAFVSAEAALGAAASRVLALVDLQPELSGAPAIAPRVATVRDCSARLAFARQLYNEAAAAYNDAARQVPTRLLTRLFGFGTAGRV